MSTAEASAGPPLATSNPPVQAVRFALFDSLRGFALLWIAWFHVASLTGQINTRVIGRLVIAYGNEALVMFFMISGCLIYRPFVAARAAGRSRPSSRRFARRRVMRIVPAYWLALTLLAIYPGIAGVFTHDWWRFYGFAQIYSERTFGQGIPQAWILCVEVSFYLALPFWAVLVRRIRIGSGPWAWLRAEAAAVGLLVSCAIVVQLLASREIVSETVGHSLLGQGAWIGAGMGIAVLSVAVGRSQGTPAFVSWVIGHSGLCWLGGAICLTGVAALVPQGGLLGVFAALHSKQDVFKTLATALLTLAGGVLFALPIVFDGQSRRGLPRRLLAWRPLAWLGLVSYGAYLWHLTIAELLGSSRDSHFSATGLGLAGSVHTLATPVLFALTMAGSAIAAAISYYGLELHLLRARGN